MREQQLQPKQFKSILIDELRRHTAERSRSGLFTLQRSPATEAMYAAIDRGEAEVYLEKRVQPGA